MQWKKLRTCLFFSCEKFSPLCLSYSFMSPWTWILKTNYKNYLYVFRISIYINYWFIDYEPFSFLAETQLFAFWHSPEVLTLGGLSNTHKNKTHRTNMNKIVSDFLIFFISSQAFCRKSDHLFISQSPKMFETYPKGYDLLLRSVVTKLPPPYNKTNQSNSLGTQLVLGTCSFL